MIIIGFGNHLLPYVLTAHLAEGRLLGTGFLCCSGHQTGREWIWGCWHLGKRKKGTLMTLSGSWCPDLSEVGDVFDIQFQEAVFGQTPLNWVLIHIAESPPTACCPGLSVPKAKSLPSCPYPGIFFIPQSLLGDTATELLFYGAFLLLPEPSICTWKDCPCAACSCVSDGPSWSRDALWVVASILGRTLSGSEVTPLCFSLPAVGA